MPRALDDDVPRARFQHRGRAVPLRAGDEGRHGVVGVELGEDGGRGLQDWQEGGRDGHEGRDELRAEAAVRVLRVGHARRVRLEAPLARRSEVQPVLQHLQHRDVGDGAHSLVVLRLGPKDPAALLVPVALEVCRDVSGPLVLGRLDERVYPGLRSANLGGQREQLGVQGRVDAGL